MNEEFTKLGGNPTPTKPILYLPVDGLTRHLDCADECFKGLSENKNYFLRDEKFVYPEKSGEDGIILHSMEANEFQSELERVFSIEKKYLNHKTGKIESREVNCKPREAQAILSARKSLLQYSLPLRLLSASPVLIERGGQPEVLQQGYHEDAGGIYVIRGFKIPSMPLNEAVTKLTDGLFADFDFVNESDYSRAIAQVLSPAMKLGNLLGNADFPLDVALADQSQAGKTHRMKFTALIYGERAYSITKNRGGVGSLDETIATALLTGKLFLLVDNVRGDFDSQLLESILRGTGVVAARAPHLKAVLAQTGRSCWQLTSNTANFTKDLANRSIITNHRKQPEDYAKRAKLPWGDDFIQLVIKNQAEYLAAVHTVIGEWIIRGKPRTTEDRHAFTTWVQSMDWIVQNIFNKAPLLDNHQSAPAILTSKDQVWLRQVVLHIANTQTLPIELQTYALREISDEASIGIPNDKDYYDEKKRNQNVGSVLARIFKESDEIEIEKHTVRRTAERLAGIGHDTKKYLII
jgi:hypothetical protein